MWEAIKRLILPSQSRPNILEDSAEFLEQARLDAETIIAWKRDQIFIARANVTHREIADRLHAATNVLHVLEWKAKVCKPNDYLARNCPSPDRAKTDDGER